MPAIVPENGTAASVNKQSNKSRLGHNRTLRHAESATDLTESTLDSLAGSCSQSIIEPSSSLSSLSNFDLSVNGEDSLSCSLHRKYKRSHNNSHDTASFTQYNTLSPPPVLPNQGKVLPNPGKNLQSRRSNWYSNLFGASTNDSRDSEFHRLFCVPANDRLLVDYSCALLDNRMIYHGRMYVSQLYVCFYSSAIVWNKINICVPWSSVCDIVRASVWYFPLAIALCIRDSRRLVFSSFVSREKVFAYLNVLWRDKHLLSLSADRLIISHNNKSYLNNNSYSEVNEIGLENFSDSEEVGDGLQNNSDIEFEEEEVNSVCGNGLHFMVNKSKNGISNDDIGSEFEINGSIQLDVELKSIASNLSSNAQPDALSHISQESRTKQYGCTDIPVSPHCPDEQLYHTGKKVFSQFLSLSVDEVFSLLFSNQSNLLSSVNDHMKYMNLSATDWLHPSSISSTDRKNSTQSNDQKSDADNPFNLSDSLETRKVRFSVNVNQPFGRVSDVCETQWLTHKHPGAMYTVLARVTNSGVPMADVFSVRKHTCLCKVDANVTHAQIWVHIMFHRRTLFARFIERTVHDAVNEFHSVLRAKLMAQSYLTNDEDCSKYDPTDPSSPCSLSACASSSTKHSLGHNGELSESISSADSTDLNISACMKRNNTRRVRRAGSRAGALLHWLHRHMSTILSCEHSYILLLFLLVTLVLVFSVYQYLCTCDLARSVERNRRSLVNVAQIKRSLLRMRTDIWRLRLQMRHMRALLQNRRSHWHDAMFFHSCAANVTTHTCPLYF